MFLLLIAQWKDRKNLDSNKRCPVHADHSSYYYLIPGCFPFLSKLKVHHQNVLCCVLTWMYFQSCLCTCICTCVHKCESSTTRINYVQSWYIHKLCTELIYKIISQFFFTLHKLAKVKHATIVEVIKTIGLEDFSFIFGFNIEIFHCPIL